MTFLIRFIWNDPGFLFPKKEWIPIEAVNREQAIAIFNYYLGTRFNYPVYDISVYEY